MTTGYPKPALKLISAGPLRITAGFKVPTIIPSPPTHLQWLRSKKPSGKAFSVGLAYILYIFFGSIGVHKLYMGKTLWGVIYLLLGVLGWITIFAGGITLLAEDAGSAAGLGSFGIICLIILGILLLIDLLTIPRQIRKQYEKTEIEIINKLLENN